MADERAMADMLGETPATPDPGFRIDVFAAITQRVRRRRAAARAARQLSLFASIGALAAVAQAARVDWSAAQPALMSIVAVAAAGMLAFGVIEGPAALMARSRAVLRARI